MRGPQDLNLSPMRPASYFEFETPDLIDLRPGAGNYFRPRAVLGFYMCLAGQIQVTYTFSKL